MYRFDVARRAVLAASGDEALLRYVAAEMDPYRPGATSGGGPEVVLRPAERGELGEVVELQGPAGDTLVTASDGEGLQLVLSGRRCSLPDPLEDRRAAYVYEPGFAVGGMYRRVVRVALQLSMLRSEAVAVHAGCVELDGGALLVAGWSETGKTETALALVERGARFVSDKWTVLGSDGMVAPFPVEVGVRRWVLSYLPRLRRSLPPAAQLQLAVAALARRPVRELERVAMRGRRLSRTAEGLGRVASLADRAPVAPSRISSAYGQAGDVTRPVPLRAVVLLTAAAQGPPRSARAEPAWAARRLARSAAYERRPYFSLVERASFAMPDRPRADTAPTVVRREEEALETALRGTPLMEVRTGFPADPRPVADLVAKWL
jgi:HPr kinase/phosphorylase